jgi:hypothetical protein
MKDSFVSVCDPFSRCAAPPLGGDGMRKKDTDISPLRAFI